MYMQMLKRIVKGVLLHLYTEDAKALSDACIMVANDKIQSQKMTQKYQAQKPKNKKPTITQHMVSGTNNYANDDDE